MNYKIFVTGLVLGFMVSITYVTLAQVEPKSEVVYPKDIKVEAVMASTSLDYVDALKVVKDRENTEDILKSQQSILRQLMYLNQQLKK